MQHSISQDTPSSGAKLTRVLLACGIIAGPFYIVVGLIQALTRPGFDLLHHDLSLLANGSLGWIQISNLIVSGLLVLAYALGMRRVLHDSRGGTWGPLLVGIYGLGLIGAGIFIADPAAGFPPGTPADAHTVSWHGLLHFITAAIGFLALIAACMVMARRFASQGLPGWTIYSVGSGLLFFAAFVGVATGSGQPWSVMGFWIGIVCIWAWVLLLAARLRKEANT
ncbi:MAG: DUF998 domain-containing protein [Ktedonobacteraceae bacterium]|nr:DUF998 domain-containing protein [Ktedonobacteraceae bacterium]